MPINDIKVKKKKKLKEHCLNPIYSGWAQLSCNLLTLLWAMSDPTHLGRAGGDS